MDRFKFLAQSLILPVLTTILFGSVFFTQVLFTRNIEATLWIETKPHQIATLKERLKPLALNVHTAGSSRANESRPSTCSVNSYWIKVVGGRGLNGNTLGAALGGSPNAEWKICSGPVYQSVARGKTVAFDWLSLGLFSLAALITCSAYVLGRSLLPPYEPLESNFSNVLPAVGVVALVSAANLFLGSFVQVEQVPIDLIAKFEERGLAILMALVLAPLVEELSYRAWLIPIATKAVGIRLAASLSTLVFAASHLPDGAIGWVFFLLAGGAYSWLWLRTRSLWTCVAAHATVNAIALMAL